MYSEKKNVSVGHVDGASAQAARDRLAGVGTIRKSEANGKFYHEIPFDCKIIQEEHLHEDIDECVRLHTKKLVVKFLNAGYDLYQRMLVDDGKGPVASASAKRETAAQQIVDGVMEAMASGDATLLEKFQGYYKDMTEAFKTGGVKGKAAWLDDLLANGGVE